MLGVAGMTHIPIVVDPKPVVDHFKSAWPRVHCTSRLMHSCTQVAGVVKKMYPVWTLVPPEVLPFQGDTNRTPNCDNLFLQKVPSARFHVGETANL